MCYSKLRQAWRYQGSNQEQLIEGQTMDKRKRTNNDIQNTTQNTRPSNTNVTKNQLWSQVLLEGCAVKQSLLCYRWCTCHSWKASSITDRVKPGTTELVFSTSLLITLHTCKSKTGWLKIRKMCPCDATWLPVDCCF